MPEFYSLKKNRDFKEVYKKGRSFANKSLVMYVFKRENNETDVLDDDRQINRIGISVSKKVGNSVVRHRIKRRIKEMIRLNDERFHKGMDIVIVARVEAGNRTYADLERDVLHLSSLHHIVAISE